MTESSSHLIDWNELREAMPVTRRWAYFEHAAVAPLPAPTCQAMQAWIDDAAANGDTNWPQWSGRLEQVRRAAAQLISADPDEIAFIPNTTTGISLVAEGFPWSEGDNVVTLADEFPSNQYPWMNLAARGVECRRVEPIEGRAELSSITNACDRRTRIIAISWVNYAHGWRNDLDAVAELAHAQGALLFIDAIQGLGMFPLDVRETPIDFLAADGHKWLLGPEGAGMLYVRREHLERLRPIGIGWNSVAHGNDYSRIELNLKPSAARYEGGTHNVAGCLGLGASLELLARHSTEQIADRLLAVTDDLCERLRAIGATVASHRQRDCASGIVAFESAGKNLLAVKKHLLSQQVVVSYRAGRLRASPHVYTNADDLDRLIEGLQSV